MALPEDATVESIPSGPESSGDEDDASGLTQSPDDLSTLRRMKAKVRQRLYSQRSIAQRIGRFLVLEKIGQGGMGLVYAAYDELLDRKVAVKVMRADEFPGEEDRVRFQREAQALARLSHPNVVMVHEVGQSEGEFYLAMEYVRGQSLCAWLRTRPSWPRVVEAFLQAGRGLAAAHAAQLVHRDFKPHNVVRTDDGVSKVLDFGLARVTDEFQESLEETQVSGPHQTLSSSLTQTGTIMGTPAYMPPEQLMAQAVDARSDQYSFCLSLWEGLTGARPFPASGGYQSMLEARLAGPPSWPSDAPAVPRRVVGALRRGLAADPDRRWPSMESLLGELSRSVEPRAPRRALGGLAVIAVALGGSWAVGQYMQVKDRCTGAEAKLEGVWDDERQRAVEAAIVGTGLPYAPGTWGRVEQRLGGYAQAWAEAHVEVCEATAVRGEQSPVVMDLRMDCLGQRRVELRAVTSVLAEADAPAVERAVDMVADLTPLSRCDDLEALRAQVPPPEDPAVARQVEVLRDRLAVLRAQQGAGRYEPALEGVEPMVEQAEALGYAPLLAEVQHRRGELRRRVGRFPEAEDDLRAAYEFAVEHRHDQTAFRAAQGLAEVVGYRQARYAEGLVWARTAVALAKRQGDPESLARSWNVIGVIHYVQGDHDEAERQWERALGLLQEELEPGHPGIARSLSHMGAAAFGRGEYEQARDYWERGLEATQEALGADHINVGKALSNIGIVQRALGEREQAKASLERALRVKRSVLGTHHPSVAQTLDHLGLLSTDEGDYERARRHYEQALQVWEATLGPDHPDVAPTLNNFGNLLARQGEHEQAEQHLERALRILEARKPGHPDVATCLISLGDLHRARAEHELARQLHERALPLYEQRGADHPNVAVALAALAETALAQEDFGAARAHAERAVSIRERAQGAPAKLAYTRWLLARTLWTDPAQRPRALEQARRARTTLAGLALAEDDAEVLAEVEGWLRARSPAQAR